MANVQAMGMSSPNSAYKQPKNWDDLTDSEKIERCREQVKETHQYYGNRIQELERRVNSLMDHSHAPDGRVMAPVNKFNGDSLTPGYHSHTGLNGVSNPYF